MDRLTEIESFVRVVETGGVGAAAERLGIAKSAVSRRLKGLETRLGARLLHRTARRLSLTETGRGYYDRCRRLLDDLEEADQAAQAQHGTLRGTLRVAAPLSFGLRQLAPAIVDFLAEHEDLAMDLDLNDRRVDLVDEGFDLAVRIGELDDSTLIARRLAPIAHVVCASPAYLARHGTPERPHDLADHVALRYTNVPERRTWVWYDDGGGEHSVTVPSRLGANNGEILTLAAEAGFGLIIQPTFIAHQSIAAGRLVPILTDVRWRRTDAYAVYPPGRHLSAKVRAAVDFLAARFGDDPPWDAGLVAAGRTRT